MKTVSLLKIGVGIFAISLNAFADNPLNTSTQSSSPQIITNQTSAHPLKDLEITAKVKEQFIQQKLFDKSNVPAMAIHVKTVHGMVYLTGKVHDKQQADNAISISQGINGVKGVKSEIKIIETKTK